MTTGSTESEICCFWLFHKSSSNFWLDTKFSAIISETVDRKRFSGISKKRSLVKSK